MDPWDPLGPPGYDKGSVERSLVPWMYKCWAGVTHIVCLLRKYVGRNKHAHEWMVIIHPKDPDAWAMDPVALGPYADGPQPDRPG